VNTRYKHHITAVVSADLIDAANALAACEGIGESGPGDLQSFHSAGWHIDGNPISFICTPVTDTVINGLELALLGEFECRRPRWDKNQEVDLESAQALIDNAVIIMDYNPDEFVFEWDPERMLLVATMDWPGLLQLIGAEKT
jgi:hypothetical protein